MSVLFVWHFAHEVDVLSRQAVVLRVRDVVRLVAVDADGHVLVALGEREAVDALRRRRLGDVASGSPRTCPRPSCAAGSGA